MDNFNVLRKTILILNVVVLESKKLGLYRTLKLNSCQKLALQLVFNTILLLNNLNSHTYNSDILLRILSLLRV